MAILMNHLDRSPRALVCEEMQTLGSDRCQWELCLAKVDVTRELLPPEYISMFIHLCI